MRLAERIAQAKADRVSVLTTAANEAARQAKELEVERLRLHTLREAELKTYRASVIPVLSELLQQAGVMDLLEEYRTTIWGGVGRVDPDPVFNSRGSYNMDTFRHPELTLSLRYPYTTVSEEIENVPPAVLDGSWSTVSHGWSTYEDEAKYLFL